MARSEPVVLVGTRGDDRLIGRDGADLLLGGDGADVLFGGRAVDRSSGVVRRDLSDGGDRLDGGRGDDRLYGGSGADLLLGGDGDDRLFGEVEARDDLGEDVHGVGRLITLAGDDRLLGGGGRDELHGRGGDDRLSGGDGRDLLLGGEGRDRLSGGRGADTVIGGEGDDLLRGGPGADLFVVSCRETLRLSELADQVFAGHDVVLDFEPGRDRLAVAVDNGRDALLGLAAFDSDRNGIVDAADAAVELVVDARHGACLALDVGTAQAALGVPYEEPIAGRHVLLIVGVAALSSGEIVPCPPSLG